MVRNVQSDKRERPRDELGRPLPWGSENQLVLEDYENLSIAENHRLGVEHFNAGRFFPAHEAWEAAWRKAEGTADKEFFQGLAQLGAGYTHYLRGNAHGARVLLERSLAKLEPYGSHHYGLDLAHLLPVVAANARLFGVCEREGRPLPAITVPHL
ncbi:MAG: DUF309 domain-containing protein [Dehalococcoidia bacterium]